MSDKILTEAFDKLKAIEESEDPFCIGELSENEEEVVEADEEVIAEVADEEVAEGSEEEVIAEGSEEDKTYSFEDDNGHHYVLEIQTEMRSGKERGFVEVNGITVATFDVGGAGSMSARISKPDEVMNMLAAAMLKADGGY